tara:strand:- start:1569 stop:1871 length:303 start_codon:yes stop_codon:yes gene_type:complete
VFILPFLYGNPSELHRSGKRNDVVETTRSFSDDDGDDEEISPPQASLLLIRRRERRWSTRAHRWGLLEASISSSMCELYEERFRRFPGRIRVLERIRRAE